MCATAWCRMRRHGSFTGLQSWPRAPSTSSRPEGCAAKSLRTRTSLRRPVADGRYVGQICSLAVVIPSPPMAGGSAIGKISIEGKIMVSRRSNPFGAAVQTSKDEKPAAAYYPDATWQHETPSELGISPPLLKEAIDFAIAGETKAPRDLVMNHYQTFGREPFGYAIGPIRERGDPTGIIIHKGYIVAEWGDPLRVDMTHSVTKSFLSSIIGVAVDRGMINSINDRVGEYVPPIQVYNPVPAGNKSDSLGTSDFLYLFETPHNRTITWDHLLRQTSDWEGTLWGKPDWADRPGDKPSEWTTRPRDKPGSVYKYNDTRVNVLSLAALNVWRRPLPQVLKENVMDPIGAWNTWRW